MPIFNCIVIVKEPHWRGFGFPRREQFLYRWNHTPKAGLFLARKALLDDVGILFKQFWLDFGLEINTKKPTSKISITSLTQSQSASSNKNARHGIFFFSLSGPRIVVIGPNKSLADFRNKVIGWNNVIVAISSIVASDSATHTWRRSRQVLSIPLAVPQRTLLWRGIRRVGLILHSRWSFPKYWTRWGDALIWLSWRSRWAWEMKLKHTITYLKSDCSKCSDTI